MVSRRRFLVSAAASLPILSLEAQEKSAAAAETAKQVEQPALPPAIAALTDRHKDIVPITIDERNSRLDLARELMKQYKIDALLVTTGAGLRYYTGGSWGQSERLFAYIIPQAAAPVIICPAFERERLGEILMQFPERETTTEFLWQESDDPFIILRRVLADNNISTGTLALEEKVPYGMANMISMAAPAIKIVSATPLTAGQRALKSPAEIALMRLANQITFDVYKAVYLSCGPGDTNIKFTSLIDKAYERCGVRGEASLNIGIYSAVPHGSNKPQVIRERDMVMVDDGCTVDGYWSDITRSFVYGAPTDKQKLVFETVQNAQSAALAAARPGAEMQDVDAAARKVIGQAGFGFGYETFTHRLGHGIGLDMHEWNYLVGGNKQKLVAGMTFSNEPGIYLPGEFGIRLEDDMIITDQGAALFTWQSPSLLDPFAIPAVVPAKDDADTPATTPAPAKPQP